MQTNLKYRAPIVALLAGCLAMLTGGCLVSSSNNEKRSGAYVSDETIKQIEPGKTTTAWVRATLGPPTKIDKIDDSTDLWKYTYTEKKDSSGAVFLIFAGSDTKETTGTVFVESRNGVVTKTWRG
jgi:outer membrane protein assembly factor BamE (lipoprotein component of BamABCDE complex)